MCGGREIHGAIWWGNTKERDYTEDLDIYVRIILRPPRWCFHLIVVRRFEYASDPESYTSGSVATGRASLAGQVEG